MYYLLDTRTNKRIIKSEDRASIEKLISDLLYKYWTIIEVKP